MAYGRLDVFWPDGRFETFTLDAPTVSIGRSTGNAIMLETDTISRYHVSITHEDDQVYITDLDSANGTFVDGVRLNSNERRLLDGVEEIQIGHLRLLFHPLDDSPTLPISSIVEDTQRVKREAASFRIDVQGPDIAISPGAYTSADLSITNTGEKEQQFTISVTGMSEKWVRINRPQLVIEPGDTQQVVLNFKPLRRSDSTPGDYTVTVRVTQAADPEVTLEADLIVKIIAYGGFGMALANRKIYSGDPFRLHLHNQGSANLPLQLSARSQNHMLNIDIPSPKITLTPGQRLQVQGEITPYRSMLFGKLREHTFDLVVQSETPAAFTTAVRAVFVEKPRFPTWVALVGSGLLAALGLLLVVMIVIIAQPAPPDPRIAFFAVNSTQIARGDNLSLNWEATDVAGFNVSINETPIITNIDAQVPGITLETDNLYGDVIVKLQGVNGDALDEVSQVVRIYQPAVVEYFQVEPPELVRNVVQSITVQWNVPGAVVIRVNGLDSFTKNEIAPSFQPEDAIENLAGLPLESFTIVLYAEDEVGNSLEQTLTVDVVNPECAPAQGDVTLHLGPDSRHQVVGTVPMNVSVVVDAQDESGQWLRAQLPGGVSGWGRRSTFICSSTFDPGNLRKALDVPPPPTLTPLPTVTPTPAPTFTLPPTQPPIPSPTARP